MNKLDTPHNIVEASGSRLDIIGKCKLFVNLPVLGKIKRRTCLILSGKEMDREILINCQMLNQSDMMHPTFPAQTISQYVRNLDRNLCKSIDNKKNSAIYKKSKFQPKKNSIKQTGIVPNLDSIFLKSTTTFSKSTLIQLTGWT